MSYVLKYRDKKSYTDRLNRFLSDRCLLFNPYTVSDRRLWEGVQQMRWGGEFSLTQMVILRVVDCYSEGPSFNPCETIVFRVGNSDEDIRRNFKYITHGWHAGDSLQLERTTINGRRISRPNQLYPLVGKSFFVSRNIITVGPLGNFGSALAMYRLKGRLAEDAAMIRSTSVAAKVEMLHRLLKYAKANVYLDGIPEEPVDIDRPISALINQVLTYPSVIPPED